MQLLQAVSAIKGGVKRFSKFVLYALQGVEQGGRCIVEKGIAVIQARERDCVQGQRLSTERSTRICQIAQMR